MRRNRGKDRPSTGGTGAAERLGSMVELYFYGRSDTGRVRSANQDSYIITRLCDNATLAVVCDGMGGAKSGNVASALSAEVFAERVARYASPKISDGVMTLDSDDACLILDDAAHDANLAVYKKSQTSPDFQGMGTTLVAALFCGDIVYVVNVGDSRLYLISDGAITQITHDHSYVQHLIDSGSLTAEEARTHPFRNRITRAVGIWEKLEADIYSVDLQSLDMCYLLLCSDGLSGQLTSDEILSIVSSDADIDVVTDTAGELADKTERLVDAANDAGGPDNITAVLVKYTSAEDRPDTSEMFSDKNTSEIDTEETGEMTITAQNNRNRSGRKNSAKSSGKTGRAAKDDKNTGSEDD